LPSWKAANSRHRGFFIFLLELQNLSLSSKIPPTCVRYDWRDYPSPLLTELKRSIKTPQPSGNAGRSALISQPSRAIVECRFCGSAELVDILDLGSQAIASRFPRPHESSPPKVPLVLVHCDRCGLVQLRHSVSRDALFNYGYGYKSGTNNTMRRHLADLAMWVQERCQLAAGDIVVDIGSNDGTLLKSYTVSALRRSGIDAIAGKFRSVYPQEIDLHEAFFSATQYNSIFGEEKAKVITSIAMFYDLESPREFVGAIRSALAPNGIWVLEQSYLPTMLEINSYDTICHEHLEYYGLLQIDWLARAEGMRVFDVERNSCNGGSFRLAVCHEGSSYAPNQSRLDQLRKLERELGLDTRAPYHAFKQRVDRLRAELIDLIEAERASGKRFYLYGASTKGNTLLQYCNLNGGQIVAAAERNPDKWGCRTPGTDIPIVSEEEARAARPDYFLVMPWHFRNEFIAREAVFRKAGGRLVFPLPTLDVV
jgi:NDP-4-keto-2,6-dideoxyhexose 3-C-methyltransferase